MFIVSMLTLGCSGLVETGSQIPTPATSSYTPTSSPEISDPANNAGNNASAYVNNTGVVRAGSFPRSFQIPGTDTLIRIGD
jgi:hypothetical protein